MFSVECSVLSGLLLFSTWCQVHERCITSRVDKFKVMNVRFEI